MSTDSPPPSGDALYKELLSLRDSLVELSRTSIQTKESLSQSHQKLDNSVKKLTDKKKALSECRSDIKQLRKNGIDCSSMDELLQEINPTIQTLNQRTVPATGSLFVRLLLGRVNVKRHRDGERVRLKSEYEKFRSRTNPAIILAGILQLVFPGFYLAQAIFQLWLLYYYVTLALREHILKVNGSSINRWWLIHHYLAILMSVIILTWNWQDPGYVFFYPQMMVFTICQGSVQVLMNRYQIGRLYNLVARGEASRMDVTAEIIDHRFVPSMTFLLPFLFVVYLFQFYNGYTLFRFYYQAQLMSGLISWRSLVVGALFCILSLGNFWTTMGTVIRKHFLSRTKQFVAVLSSPLGSPLGSPRQRKRAASH